MISTLLESLRRPGTSWSVSKTAPFISTIAFCVILGVGCDRAESDADKNESSSSSTATAKAESESESSSSPSGSASGEMMSTPSDKGGSDNGQQISDDQLERYADALQQLEPKRKELKETMDQVDSIAEEKKARMKVMKAVRKAVRDAGLDLKVFRQISQRLQREDQELRSRLREVARSQ